MVFDSYINFPQTTGVNQQNAMKQQTFDREFRSAREGGPPDLLTAVNRSTSWSPRTMPRERGAGQGAPNLRIVPRTEEPSGGLATLLRYQGAECRRTAFWHAMAFGALGICSLAGVIVAFW